VIEVAFTLGCGHHAFEEFFLGYLIENALA
jgi:hypothetical protein